MSSDGLGVSFLQYELASTIEQAVRGAVETVLRETARVVSARLTAARDAAAESRRENRSLRERLEASEGELRAVRYYVSAAEKNIKQCFLLDQRRPGAEGSASCEGGLLQLQRGRSLRSAAARNAGSKAVPSVGLCLPTVQSDWPRRRVRTTGKEPASSRGSAEADSEPERTGGEVEEFYIAEENGADKDYKASGSSVQDFGRVQEEQEVAGLSSKALDDPSDLGKYEFEVGAPASTVTELGLIQVLDGNQVKQSAVKIEDDPELQSVEPPVTDPMTASSISPSVSTTHSQQMISDGDALLGLMPPIEGDVTLTSGAEFQRDSADKVHRCNVCGRGFRRFYCLKTHQRIHTGERPYPCRYCEKRFRHLDSLHKHQRIHTGERPYRCALCGCCFRELGQLKKHRLKHSPTSGGTANMATTAPHTSLSLIPAGASYIWPHLNSQSLDSV